MTETTSVSMDTKPLRPGKGRSARQIIAELLQKRGYQSENLKDFLSWNLNELPDLTRLHDLEKAALRLIEAVDKKQVIGIYGDYDVDGTTSCALLYHFFALLETEVKLYQPSRFVEGYGLHLSSIDKAREEGVDVLVTVDCGITNCEAADYALEKNIDLIITDHHKDAREHLPRAYAVVNPNRRDEPIPNELGSLAGVGVAFALCLKFKQIWEQKHGPMASLYPLLQFVAVGTICDLARLTPMNLKLVRHGLKQIGTSTYPGIRAFFTQEERQLALLPSEKISFGVGPLINSKGRLEHPERALRLLTAKDSTIAYENYSHLEVSNRERKIIQSEVFTSAKAKVIDELGKGPLHAAVVYSPDWHEGVIGIVASKLVETFKIPAIVFTNGEEKGLIKGSARSAGDLNIFDQLNACSDLFVKFGGHKAAAGLSMPESNFNSFKARLMANLDEVPPIERTVLDSYDLELLPSEISPALVKEMENLEPFGMGNEKPLFKVTGLQLDSYDILKDVHVRWNLSTPNLKLRGISFNFVDKWDQPSVEELYRSQFERKQELTVYCHLGINRWNGNEYIQLQIHRVETY